MRSTVMLAVVFLAIAISLPFGIIVGTMAVQKISSLKKELTCSQESTKQTEQQLGEKDRQIAQLSEEIKKLSEGLKTAKTQETLNLDDT